MNILNLMLFFFLVLFTFTAAVEDDSNALTRHKRDLSVRAKDDSRQRKKRRRRRKQMKMSNRIAKSEVPFRHSGFDNFAELIKKSKLDQFFKKDGLVVYHMVSPAHEQNFDKNDQLSKNSEFNKNDQLLKIYEYDENGQIDKNYRFDQNVYIKSDDFDQNRFEGNDEFGDKHEMLNSDDISVYEVNPNLFVDKKVHKNDDPGKKEFNEDDEVCLVDPDDSEPTDKTGDKSESKNDKNDEYYTSINDKIYVLNDDRSGRLTDDQSKTDKYQSRNDKYPSKNDKYPSKNDKYDSDSLLLHANIMDMLENYINGQRL